MILNGDQNPDTTTENPIIPVLLYINAHVTILLDTDTVPTAAHQPETDEIVDVPNAPAPDHTPVANVQSKDPNIAEILHPDDPITTDHIPLPPHEMTHIVPIPNLMITTTTTTMKWYPQKLHMITRTIQTIHHQEKSSHNPTKHNKQK